MDLPGEIAAELDQARKADAEGNDGKVRVCARRAVGRAFVLSSFSTGFPPSFSATQSLKAVSELKDMPESVRVAAMRLSAGVAENGGLSISMNPIEDALIIIHQLLGK
jgi:hypothetical protein